MVLHGRGLPALGRAAILGTIHGWACWSHLPLAFSPVETLEGPGAGAILERAGRSFLGAAPCPVRSHGCLSPSLECCVSWCGLEEQTGLSVLCFRKPRECGTKAAHLPVMARAQQQPLSTGDTHCPILSWLRCSVFGRCEGTGSPLCPHSSTSPESQQLLRTCFSRRDSEPQDQQVLETM